jgi:hypothetical protein
MTRDLRDDLEPHDADELLPVAERLRASRPVPRAAWRGDLRRWLLSRAGAPRPRPAHLWARIGASFAAGTLLLSVAALGVGGAGPFAA